MPSLEEILSTSENSVLINVFQFPYLSADECQSLTNQILANRYSHPHEGSMQKYTVDVTPFLTPFLTKLLDELTPVVNDLYEFGKPSKYLLYTAHAILYDANGEGEKWLTCHTDDSDITINLTLMTETLEGNELRFLDTTPYGNLLCLTKFEKLRKQLDETIHIHSLKPQVGTCILHRGSHAHETSVIHKGKRVALILWLKKNQPE